MFIGTHELSLDPKGRLTFPVGFRARIEKHAGGVVVVTRNFLAPCLRIYPSNVWPKVVKSLESMPARQSHWRRFVASSATSARLDAAGRIVLTPMHREAVGLVQRVALVGDLTRMELWDHAAFMLEMKETMTRVPSDEFLALEDPAGVLDDGAVQAWAMDEYGVDLAGLPAGMSAAHDVPDLPDVPGEADD